MNRGHSAVISSVLSIAVSSNSMLAPLVSVLRDIVCVTQTSNRKEWLEFGEYVQNLVRVLIDVLASNPGFNSGSLSGDLQTFQRTLEDISKKVSYLNKTSTRWFRVLDVERRIVVMRQQLSDALSLFQTRAMLVLLSRAHPIDNTPGEGSVSGSRTLPPSQNLTGPKVIPQRHRNPISKPQVSQPQVNNATASKSRPGDQRKIPLSLNRGSGDSMSTNSSTCSTPSLSQDGERLYNPAHEEPHTNRLAATWHRLSDSMASTGELEDALALSQAAARLYRTQAERQLSLYYQS